MDTLYCGIDSHSNNNGVVVTNEEDSAVNRKRLHNELGDVLEALSPFETNLAGTVVESPYNWYWLAVTVHGVIPENTH